MSLCLLNPNFKKSHKRCQALSLSPDSYIQGQWTLHAERDAPLSNYMQIGNKDIYSKIFKKFWRTSPV